MGKVLGYYPIPLEIEAAALKDQKWRDRHALATVHYRVISLMSRSSTLDGYAAHSTMDQIFKICIESLVDKDPVLHGY